MRLDMQLRGIKMNLHEATSAYFLVETTCKTCFS